MALKVRCHLCIMKQVALPDASRDKQVLDYTICSTIIPANNQEAMQLLGAEIVTHMQAHHMDELKRIPQLAVQFNGFSVMKYMEGPEDSLFEKEKESMRDLLLEEVLYCAPEDEDDEDIEDEDYDDDDLDEDEEEDLEDAEADEDDDEEDEQANELDPLEEIDEDGELVEEEL